MKIRSPWWYKRRDAVFGIIYGVGFGAGIAFAAATNGTYLPLFVQAGARFGDAAADAAAAVMVALVALCYAVRLWGSSYLRAHVVWSDDARTDSLTISGPFRYVRNPLYLGNVFMAIGIGGFTTLAGWIVMNALNLVFILALIRWEERGLLARYSEQFEAYRRSVPALFPRLTPVPEAKPVCPSLREGLRGEIFVAALLVGMITILLWPNEYGIAAFVVLYVGGIIAQRAAAGN